MHHPVIQALALAGLAIAAVSASAGDSPVMPRRGDAYTLRAGILARTLDVSGGNLTTTKLTVDGVEALDGPTDELSFVVTSASPNVRPIGLRPGEGAEVDLDSGEGANTDTLTEKRGEGVSDSTNVTWIDPVQVESRAWASLVEPPQLSWQGLRGGIHLHWFRAEGKSGGPLAGLSTTVYYETVDNHPAIRKWVEIENHGRSWRKLSNLTIDNIALGGALLHPTELTPSERGARACVVGFSAADRSRGLLCVSEVPSALRAIGERGAMGYNPDLFEWILGPGERFTSEPVFLYAYSGKVEETISGVSTPLDRTVEGPYLRYLEAHIGIAGRSAPVCAPLWASWTNFGPKIDDAIVREQADIAARCGFNTLELDCGWQAGIHGVTPDPQKFPDFAATARHVRSKGLRLGLWVSDYRTDYDKDLREMREGLVIPTIRRWGGVAMSWTSPWREYYARDLVETSKRYDVSYFKQDFSNIKFGDIAEGHESRSRRESALRGLRGLLTAQDKIRAGAPEVAAEITHEIYWGTPGVPCDLAVLKHAALYHIPPNDYSGVGHWKQRFSKDWTYDPARMHELLLRGCWNARQRFYAHRGLPLYGIEYYGAATVNIAGSLTPEVQDRQVCSWLMGEPSVFSGDLASLTEENIQRYRARFDLLKRLQKDYGIYYHFQYSGVPQPTDTDWHWWGKLNERGCGAVVVLRGSGGAEERATNVPWVKATSRYHVRACFADKQLGTFTGRQLQAGAVKLALPAYGQEILELAPAR